MAETVPYALIGEAFQNRSVVPFLGAASSLAGANRNAALPSGKEFARILARAASYPGPDTDPLSKIAQFYEEGPGDRGLLLSKVINIFAGSLPQDYTCAATDFFLQLPMSLMPTLLVTTNYDVLLERTLERRGIRYLSIAHIVRNSKYAGRFLCYDSLNAPLESCIRTKTQLEEMLLDLDESASSTVLVYKLHGTAQAGVGPRNMIDSVVLTESDYIEFLEDERLDKIPSRILKTLREANIMFLGYSLEDWNFRVLLQRLHRVQQQQKQRANKHWACRLMDMRDEVELQFWAIRGVNLYSIPLQDFLYRLLSEMGVGA
jgi:SIR2-like domain